MQDIYEFVDTSNVGDLLLKTMMCNLGNLSPFWQVDPFHACKFGVVTIRVTYCLLILTRFFLSLPITCAI